MGDRAGAQCRWCSRFVVLLFSLTSAPDLKDVALASADRGLAYIVKDVIESRPGRLLLADVAFAIFVCTLSVHTGTVRVVFAMARDGRLPFSASFARVSQSTHTSPSRGFWSVWVRF